MKSLSATMPTDDKWATRLEKLLAGGFSETVLEATVFAPDGTELFKCPGVLEVEKGEWLLRLLRPRAKKGIGHLMDIGLPSAATYDRSHCMRVCLDMADHTTVELVDVWPEHSSKSSSNFGYYETRHRSGALKSKPRENPVAALHPEKKWTQSRVHGFVPGVALPHSMRGAVKSTLKLPLLGERSSVSSVWTDKRKNWEWLAVGDDRGLALYLQENSDLSPEDARKNFDAFTMALGFVLGRQLRCCHVGLDFCGKLYEGHELQPPEAPGGEILRPVPLRFASSNPDWTNDLVWSAYDFLKNREQPIVRLVTNAMLSVYRTEHDAVPNDTRMLVLCTRLEKLIKVLYESAKTVEGADKGKKKKYTDGVKREELWRHASNLLDVSWDKGLSKVYRSWEDCRHKLAHGDPEVFSTMRGDAAFRHFFLLQGGFNAILAGFFRCQTSILISPMESNPTANVRLSIQLLKDQAWEKRIVTVLNAVTFEMAGYDEASGI